MCGGKHDKRFIAFFAESKGEKFTIGQHLPKL